MAQRTPKVEGKKPPMSVHFNGNLLCAIDTETSGLKPGHDDLIQLAIIPLRPDLTINKDIIPFHTLLQPKRPWNWDAESGAVSKHKLEEVTKFGLDPWSALEAFEDWFKRLGIAERKLIVPLGHNYNHDKGFLLDWTGGPETYASFFHGHVRDTMSMALFINDMHDWVSEEVPFTRVKLSILCKKLGVELMHAHDALSDAAATAECYRRMIMKYGTINHLRGGPETPVDLGELGEDE